MVCAKLMKSAQPQSALLLQGTARTMCAVPARDVAMHRHSVQCTNSAQTCHAHIKNTNAGSVVSRNDAVNAPSAVLRTVWVIVCSGHALTPPSARINGATKTSSVMQTNCRTHAMRSQRNAAMKTLCVQRHMP